MYAKLWSQEMSSDVKLRMKPTVAVEKLNFQSCNYKSEEKQQYPCSGYKVRKITEQNSSDCSRPSHLTYRNDVEGVAVQNRSNSRVEKSLTRTTKREEKQCRSGTAAGHKDSFDLGEAPLEKSNHQEDKLYGMQFQESQQQNEAFSTVETSSYSSTVSSECFIVEDENGCSPIVEIANQKEPQTCSDIPITEQQKFYKEFMYELVKLKQDLERERGMRRKLESKISHQSQKIKSLKLKALPKEVTLKNPPIRLKLEAVAKGKYISTLDDSESSDACSPNYSHDAVEEIKPELCEESPTEDDALDTDGLHLQKSTHDSLANMNEIQRPVTDNERMQVSGRQRSKKKNSKEHRCAAFDDSVSYAINKAADSSRKRNVSQDQLQTNSENSMKKLKNSFEIGDFSSTHLITSKEGVIIGVLNTGIKLEQQTESTACTKEVEVFDKRTDSVLKGSEYNSVNEGLSSEGTAEDIAGKRHQNELFPFSEITSGNRVKIKMKANGSLMNQSCSDDRNNNQVTRNDTTDTSVARNHDKQLKVSEGKTNKKLRKVVKNNGNLQPLSNLDIVTEKQTLLDSVSHKNDELEVRKTTRKKEHLRNQSNFGLVDEDCNLSNSCSRNHFTDIKSGTKVNTIKSNGDLMHQSCPDLVSENCSLYEPRSRDHDLRLQVSEMKRSNTEIINLKQKCAEMNKYNSSPPSINCTIEDNVLCSKGRTRNISLEHKAKNPCKSSLDYIYGCNLCGLKFSGIESLQCHMPCGGCDISKDPLKCGACGKTFRESVDLEKHLQGFSANKLFKCEICSKNCASKSCLVWHMQIHVDIRSEKCENQSKTFLSRDAKTSQKSSECTICNKGFLSKLCLQSHMKQHKENDRESHSRVIVDFQPENSVIPEKRSQSQELMNRSFQDALDNSQLCTADLVKTHTDLPEQNSRMHCDGERSSWSIFDLVGLFCDSGSSSPLDLHQNKISREQSRSSVSIFDLDTSSKIANGQAESAGLICAQEISSKIKKTYRPYCVKCWDTFEDLQALEQHAKFCNESCRESSPREVIPISANECSIAKSDDQCQSSECVMENGSEEVAVKSVEDVAENGSADVAEDNSFEVLKSGSGMMATNKLHGGIDEEANDGLDEVANSDSHDWAKNSSDRLARREPNDLASMIHVLAKNAADDLVNSESDDLAESFSEELANIESYLAKGESDFSAVNGSQKVANFASYDLAENGSDDVGKNGSDDSVEYGSRQVIKIVLGDVKKNGSSKCFSSGSHDFIKSGLTDSTKSRSDSVTKNSSPKVNLIKSGSQKMTKSLLYKSSKCGFDEALYCLNCHKTFSSLQRLNKHIELHRLFGSSLRCSRCNHKFSLLDSLQEHTCQAYSIVGPQFRCPECEEGFEIGKQLKKHMSEVHSVEQHWKCKHCGKQYEKFCLWNNHVQAHRTERRYVCNKCGKKFKFLRYLKSDHLPCLSDAAELKCPKCNQEFVKASRLRSHMTLCQNEQAMKCQHCPRLFSKPSRLDKHMRCHTSEKPYQCSQCDKCFSVREGLISHVHRHSTEKPYVCDVCGKAFAARALLQSHLRMHCTDRKKFILSVEVNGASNQVHMKEKEKQMPKRFYGCGLCGSLYMAMISLKRHLPCGEGGAGDKDSLFCGECNVKFCEENELEKHIATVHSENLFSCSMCNKLFVKELYMKLHMRSHSGERPYKCKQCSKDFKRAHHLKDHLPCYVSPGSDIQCNQCQMTFLKLSQLRTHLRKDHSKSVRRDVCGKKFARRRALDIHLKRHVQERKKPYSCMNCTKSFVHSSSLRRHLETVHLDILKCNVGNENVHSKYLYDAYLKSQNYPITEVTDNVLCCLNCHKIFSSHQKLKKHLELHKQFGSSLSCSRCNQKFSLLDSLQEHTCHAYSILGPQFRCPECEEGFEISRQLKKHMSEVHSVEQPFKCKSCDRQYEKFCQWNNHVQAHRTDRRYVCNKCGKRFKFLHHLKSGHLPCLSDAAELKCPKCNQKFVKASKLRNHMALCQNERAVQCQVCGQLFLNQLLLDKHMRCHTGEKPYQCSQCDKCFSFRQGLISHIYHHHSAEKRYVCDVCGKAFAAKAYFQSHLRIHMTYRKKRSVRSKVNGSSNQVQMKEKQKRMPKRFYGCGLCGSLFVAMISLKQHLPCAGGVTGEESLFCGKCNKKFCEENELEKHIASVHSEIFFSCSICNKMFVKKWSLKLHMHSHTGERPYKCKRCSKGFQYRHHLKYHLPCYVSPGSEIQCDQCQMTFHKISHLRTHINKEHSNKAVQCDVCGKKFVGRHGLDVHLKSHAKERKKPYSCTHCTKCFLHSSSLKRHLETVLLDPLQCNVDNKNIHSKYQYDAYLKSHISAITTGTGDALYCLNCRKTFSSHEQLNKHLDLHKRFGSSLRCSHCNHKFSLLDSLQEHTCQAYSILGPQFRCPECEEGFEIGKQLKTHMFEVHSLEQPFKCKRCDKQYEKFCQWNNHVQAHRTDRFYVCNKCGRKFKFLHHLKSDHLPCLSDAAELKCPKCNQEFVKASLLRNHMTLCQNDRAIKCQHCNRLFNNLSKLDKHMRCHTGEKPYQCSQCDKCFSVREGLISHVHRHSAVKPYICDVCGKSFAVETFLRSHLRIHTTDRPYKCSECDMSFVYECYLRYHKTKVHRGVKERFACSICSKTFCTKMYLNTHMLSHTGQNPYLCSFCGKGFRAKILLKYHLRVHTGEKPYACQYCYMRFSMPRSMRNHERVHTGEKPYECTICGMKFPQSSYLKNHSKKVHKVE